MVPMLRLLQYRVAFVTSRIKQTSKHKFLLIPVYVLNVSEAGVNSYKRRNCFIKTGRDVNGKPLTAFRNHDNFMFQGNFEYVVATRFSGGTVLQ